MDEGNRRASVPCRQRGPVLRCALLVATLAASAGHGAESAGELLTRARQALGSGHVQQAMELANQAITEEPENARGYTFRAGLYEALGEPEKALSDYDRAAALRPDEPGIYQRRGILHFQQARPDKAVADFDRFLELRPGDRPYHWQRGIALYYAGKFDEGARQFESHRKVNPDDVENAVWHYLCVARAHGLEKARASFFPTDGDDRVPMMQIHALFAGKATPDDVLKAAKAANPDPKALRNQGFYAHLYLALYYEAQQKSERAQKHIEQATGPYAMDHYMGDVARVHEKLRKEENGE